LSLEQQQQRSHVNANNFTLEERDFSWGGAEIAMELIVSVSKISGNGGEFLENNSDEEFDQQQDKYHNSSYCPLSSILSQGNFGDVAAYHMLLPHPCPLNTLMEPFQQISSSHIGTKHVEIQL
ncbi:hypothetical protein KI387_040133, partial [Taxus chinensis]